MNRKTVLAKLAAIGATLDTECEEGTTLVIDAPRGHTWNANGHWSYSEAYRNSHGQSWKPEAWAALAEAIDMGVEPMTLEEMERYEYECDEDLSDLKASLAG